MKAPHFPRAEALAAGETVYLGSLCPHHPEAMGLRRTSHKGCHVCVKKAASLKLNSHRNIKGKALKAKVQATEESAIATAIKLATAMSKGRK